MAKQIRQVGRALIVVIPFVLIAVLLLLPPQETRAAPYANPFWTNASPSPECACSGCDCVRPAEFSPEGVSYRTGELVYDHFVFSMPGLLGDEVFALTWRSMTSGATEAGVGMHYAWLWSVQTQILNPKNPNAPGGHQALVRRPDGLILTFSWTGTAYIPVTCGVTDALVAVGGGVPLGGGGGLARAGGGTTLASGGSVAWILTDKHGGNRQFNSQGQPMLYVDRNGNTRTLAYNAAWQLTSFVDDRGGSYTVQHTANGYFSSVTDPAGQTWVFAYDPSDNLTSVTSPPTPDQPTGIVTSYAYDSLNRLVSVTDGRGNTVRQFAYVGTTRQVQMATVDGHAVTFVYAAGRTDRTDANGNVHRVHYTSQNITATDQWIDSQAKYAHQYRYAGTQLTTHVMPRGNRIDYGWDAWGNLLTRRHRTSDTSINDPSDLVHQWAYNTSSFQTSYTDPLGNTWTYARDTAGNLTSVTHPTVTNPTTQTAATHTTYNAAGQPETHLDEEGLLTTWVYVQSGPSTGWPDRVQVGPSGSVLDTSFQYDLAGNVVARTNPRGDTTTYTFDSLRRMTATQAPAPLSYLTQAHYDGNGNLVQRDVENRDRDGVLHPTNPWFTTTYTYTNRDQVASMTEEIDETTTRTTSFEYDGNGNRVLMTKPEGNKERRTVDERDLVVTHTRGADTPLGSTVTTSYDDNANVLTVTNGRGHATSFQHDLFDRRTRVTDALGGYTQTVHDKNGNVTEVSRWDAQDVGLQRTWRSYDERGRHWQTSDLRKDPGQAYPDAVTTVERLRTGQVRVVTDARGGTTTTTFDTWHRPSTVTDAIGDVASSTYDQNGNRTAWSIQETDGQNSVTHQYEATYDVLNRRLTTVEIDRTNSQNHYTTTAAYDSRSNRVWQTDAKGDPTRWTFDGLGRMTMRERALTIGTSIETFTSAQVTQWGFDANDRLVSHTDDGSNASTWTFDALDRPVTITYPDTGSASYVHDAAHNVVQVTDPAGNVVVDVFDPLNRNTQRTVTRATGYLGTTSETRTYDAIGRLLTAADDDYSVTLEYADLGLRSMVYSERQEYVGGAALPKTVTKTYDAVGSKATELYPSGLSLGYTTNAIGLLTAISDGSSTIASFSNWGARPKGVTYGNGATTAYTYGGFRQDVTSVDHKTSTQTTILRLDYGYDKVHDRLFERHGAAGSSGDGYAYDKLRRLTTAWMGSATPSAPAAATYTKKIDYNMDDDGNRTSVAVTPWGASPTSTPYTTNNAYQYTQVGTTAHVWDTNGNLTDDGTLTFTYDYRNLPVVVKVKATGVTVATYRYDALGRRVEKDIGSNNKQRYVYTGLETIATYNAFDTWKQDFVYAQGIDQIVMLEQADVLDYDSDQNTTETTRSYYHRNALGSVMEITDANEATVVSYRYDPYGKVTITRGGQVQSVDPLGQHWTFTARFLDEESGLYYYRARYYDSIKGRFLQRDPLGYQAGPGLYVYCDDSPLSQRDPLGLLHMGTQPQPALRGIGEFDYGGGGGGCGFSLVSGLFVWLGLCAAPQNPRMNSYHQGCPPCPVWKGAEIDAVPPSKSHFPCPGDHWHYYGLIWQEPPPACTCHYSRYFGGCCGADKSYERKMKGDDRHNRNFFNPIAPC